jgi:Ras GTPase-activating protein 1
MATQGESPREAGFSLLRDSSDYGWADEGDDALVGPVYLRLDDPAFRSYVQYANTTYEQELEEEVGDDEIGLDLSAPPPESWFHGRISRQLASTRLQDLQGEQGVYLVRESETQPGDYAISYLSRTGYVHHFKINSNCGDYFIGGRQFLSLSELIGFYSNCSCILENESLEVPVVPPKPVPLYMMLRATAPHLKNSGSDELNIDAWEVFILLSRLNDDWGWGRSQRTGESGLIPLMIMEDVSYEDPNLGKEWYHGSISREEVLELLTHKGNVGSFLVRLSSVEHSERHYSLSVKTPEKVQRFRITRYDTGYYVFGGRPFSSMDDVIDRYKSEVIIDGITLGSPILQRTMPVNSPPMNIPSPRDRTDSIILTQAQRQGEKSGLLLLRKGKKSPVYGKWKEFYFVIKYGEQQLLYYERESSHKAKGLLDLKQCQAFAVDPTLYGRNDCLLVMLKYLNELSFYYLAAGTQENAQEWLRVLKRYTLKTREAPKSEVQQIRSLSLSIRDCKLAKPGAHPTVYCLVSLDGAALAKSIIVQMPCTFDENYKFQDLPLSTIAFSVEMISASKRMYIKDSSIGRVTIQLSDMPNGQDDDKWHQLMTKTSRTSQGSVRLVANFKHEIIFPIDEYTSLKDLLVSDNVVVIEALAKVCKDHHADLACTLIRIFCHYNRVLPIINTCLGKSIEREDNVATLFRASTLATVLMDQLMKLTAIDYLHAVLKGPVEKIADLKDSCELDPTKLPRGTDLNPHLHQLEKQVQNLLVSIFTSVDSCPQHLRYIFHCLQDRVVQKWPTDETVRTRAVSGFLFLRFICPALINPLHFNLLSIGSNQATSRDRLEPSPPPAGEAGSESSRLYLHLCRLLPSAPALYLPLPTRQSGSEMAHR